MKRVVVKIGSSLLTTEGATLSIEKLDRLVDSIATLHQSGVEVVVVTSGAIAAGFTELGYVEKPTQVAQKQAAAAVGQSVLMHAYRHSFSRYALVTAQILLSRKDFAERKPYTNALNTIELLLECGAVPIINENDSVATRELTFGDNDILAALVASLVHAELVLILTDIDAFYTANPRTNPEARKITEVLEVTAEHLRIADMHGGSVGTGGMLAKVKAAEVSLSMGCPLYVGSGTALEKNSLCQIIAGQGSGTYFGTTANPMSRKRQWIAYHAEVEGQVIVDAGAEKALIADNGSLLPVGVQAVIGTFARDAVVAIVSSDARLIAKGIVRYSSEELQKIQGLQSSVVRTEVSQDKVDVINRDNLVALLHV